MDITKTGLVFCLTNYLSQGSVQRGPRHSRGLLVIFGQKAEQVFEQKNAIKNALGRLVVSQLTKRRETVVPCTRCVTLAGQSKVENPPNSPLISCLG